MTRIAARELALHLIFTFGFESAGAGSLLEEQMNPERFAALGAEYKLYAEFPDELQARYITAIVQGVSAHLPELDGYIEKYAIDWRVERISRVATAIMRLCMYEVLYMSEVPDSAAINAAIELAKKYESPESAAFINGILGSFARAETIQNG